MSKVYGQDRDTFSGNYDHTMFSRMVDDLEHRYDLKFYYDQELDSLPVDISFDEIILPQLMDQMESLTNSHFFLYGKKMVIGTGDFFVHPALDRRIFMNVPKEAQNPTDELTSLLDHVKENENKKESNDKLDEVIQVGRYASESGPRATISGVVRELKTGDPVIGATVLIKDPQTGVATDAFGYYSLTLTRGEYELYVNSVGMKPVVKKISLKGDGKLNFDLLNDIISLKEVIVKSEIDNVERTQTGLARINISNIRQLPSIMGEADIMKIALNLPGVQTVGEGAGGINVRGGTADQNLVLLNDVPVFNTNHVFGFLSVFNPDVIAGASLFKSGISANFGGRISSVFDVALKDGNKKKFQVKGGISPVTAKLSFEGPIKKDTSSFIVGVRTTYSDWVFSILDDPALRRSSASFYDVVGKITHKFNDKNELVISSYYSNDNFRLNSDSLYDYSSSNASVQWRHMFSNRLNMTSAMSYAHYAYHLSSESNLLNAFQFSYEINQLAFKTEFNYFTRKNVSVKAGFTSAFYDLQPGMKLPMSPSSLTLPIILSKERGLESALYSGAEYEINNKLSLYAGVRVSMFNRLGPGTRFIFQPDKPSETIFIEDTIFYPGKRLITTYLRPEPRVSARYKLMSNLSVKISYDRMNQYIHVLSNTISISPIDAWRLSGVSVKPQGGDQYAAGLYKKISGTSLQLSLEGYYRRISNVLAYKDGADLLLNRSLQTDLVNAKGKAYGVELLVKKNSGKFTGWITYSYSRSLVQAKSSFPSEQINNGKYYPSNVDKPHSLLVATNFKVNRRFNLSANFTYSTGRPSTFPLAKYIIKNQAVLHYANRNQFRIPDYLRLDMAMNVEGNHKVNKRIHSSWSFSVYNLLGRANAYSVFFQSDKGIVNGYKLSVFSHAIPTVTYHFKFI